MACAGNNKEALFLAAIEQVTNWTIINNQLLLSNDQKLVAKFNGVLPTLKPPVMDESSKLNGNWELNYISGPRIAFEGLYPEKKPTISFDLIKNEIMGNSSCNQFSASFSINGYNIQFGDPRATKMFCEGGGESTFFNMLKKVNKYGISDGNTLTFMIDDVAVMRFIKK